MSERPAMSYSRHVIFAGEPATMDHAVAALTALADAIAVNVRAEESAEPVAISEESLRHVIDGSRTHFVVDAVPMAVFLDVLRTKIADLHVEAERFRATLRSEYIEETVAEWQSIVRHLDQTLFLLRGFALQRPNPELAAATTKLSQARDAVLLAVDARDNVAAMDTLRYEIAPALEDIHAVLERLR